MSEKLPTHESPRVSRQEVIEAYRKFSEAGLEDPADLDTSNPEVTRANDFTINGWPKVMQMIPNMVKYGEGIILIKP